MIRALQALLAWLMFMAVLAGAAHIAAVLYIPGFVMSRAMERISANGGVNAIAHGPPVTAASRTVVRPSPDLLYSTCVFNLAQDQLRIRARVPEDGYWSISMFDANTDTFFVRNNVTGAGGVADLLLVGPGGTAPPGNTAQVVQAPSFKGIVLFRRLIVSRDDIARLDAERQDTVCEPAAH